MTRLAHLASLAAALAGCSGGGGVPLADGGTTPPPPVERPTAVLLALPVAGGAPTYLDAATLRPIAGLSSPKLPAFTRVWGIEPSTGTVFGLTPERRAVGVELESGRTTEIAQQSVIGFLSPTGIAYAVTANGQVVSVRRRERTAWRSALPSGVTALFGRRDGRLVARVHDEAGAHLISLGPDDAAPSILATSSGPMALARHGEFLALASTPGIALLDLSTERPGSIVPVNPPPAAMVFSPSGHRLYFTRAAAGIGTIDRFAGREIDGLPVPAGGTTLRGDPLGRWLLVATAPAESVRVVDAAARRYVGAVAAPWDEALPIVTPDGVLLLADGDELVARDPATLRELARHDRRGAHWVATTYLPRSLAAAARMALAEPVTGDTARQGQLYVQIASSQNPAWAAQLAMSLARDARLPARVLEPESPNESYRVVLGPYRTREEANAVGTRLGRPFWIFTAEPEPSR